MKKPQSSLQFQRRQAREWAIQLLFQLDFNPGRDMESVLEDFWEQQWCTLAHDIKDDTGAAPLPPETPAEAANIVASAKLRGMVESFVKGVVEHREKIDAHISSYLQNRTLNRLSVVDRNVLRLAFFEMFYSSREIPHVAVLNEAIDLAKYFSSRESSRFINGILDRAIKEKRMAEN